MIKAKYIYGAIWFLAALFYGGFLLWFFNTQAPLTAGEIGQHLNSYTSLYRHGRASEKQIRLRGFLAGDDGGEVYTLHLVRMRADVKGGAGQQLSVFDLLARWSDPFLLALYSRASYPVMSAPATSDNLTSWNVVDEGWTHFVVMRHRSRRDLMAVVNDRELARSQDILLATIESSLLSLLRQNNTADVSTRGCYRVDCFCFRLISKSSCFNSSARAFFIAARYF